MVLAAALLARMLPPPVPPAIPPECPRLAADRSRCRLPGCPAAPQPSSVWCDGHIAAGPAIVWLERRWQPW